MTIFRAALLISVIVLGIMPFHVSALRDVTGVIDRFIPNADLVGECRVNYLFFKIYDVALFAESGTWQPGEPFALSLSYLREIRGDAIVARTLKEIREQGFNHERTLERWGAQLRTIIPDVMRHDHIDRHRR